MSSREMPLPEYVTNPAKLRELRLEHKIEDYVDSVQSNGELTDEEMQDPSRMETIRKAAERELQVEDLEESIKNIERRAKELLDSTPDVRAAIQQALEEEFKANQ